MKVAIASDHAGYPLKEQVKKYLSDVLGHNVVDMGPSSADSVDYPDFAHKVSRMISSGDVEKAVLICGSGIGMCMAANRHKNVRAVVLHDKFDAEMSRSHNDANCACLGARNHTSNPATELLELWFKTPFEGGRHSRRVSKIEK